MIDPNTIAHFVHIFLFRRATRSPLLNSHSPIRGFPPPQMTGGRRSGPSPPPLTIFSPTPRTNRGPAGITLPGTLFFSVLRHLRSPHCLRRSECLFSPSLPCLVSFFGKDYLGPTQSKCLQASSCGDFFRFLSPSHCHARCRKSLGKGTSIFLSPLPIPDFQIWLFFLSSCRSFSLSGDLFADV